MAKKPEQVIFLISDYMRQGWNKVQATSMAWCEFFEEKMNQLDYQTRHRSSFFGPEIRIDAYCKDCKDGGHMLPETTKQWLWSHKGHNTKTYARK